MTKLYEARYKQEFMNTLKNKENYEWLFDKSFEYEHRFSKDIYDFNKDEIMEFLKSGEWVYSTLIAVESYISTYTSWAIQRGYKLNKKNATDEIQPKELREIAKNEDVIHVDYIYSMIGIPGAKIPTIELNNYQDKLLVYLLFIGIRGDRAKYLLDLKYEHIDFENRILKLSEIDNDKNDIRLDQIAYNLLLKAKNEKIYTRYIDISKTNTTNTREDYELVDSEYVFKKASGSVNMSNPQMTYSGMLGRMRSFANHTGLKITMNNIEKAGITYIGYKILENGMELTADNPVVIGSIFNRYNITDEQARWKLIRQLKKDIPKTYGVGQS